MPLIRRIPKRGFRPRFKRRYEIVKLGSLDRFEENSVVTPERLKELNIIKKVIGLKVLGGGAISKPLKVLAHAFSKEAKKKIEAAGGRAEII